MSVILGHVLWVRSRYPGTSRGKQSLTKLIKAHQTGQQIVLRARIILAAGSGDSNSQIGRDLDVDADPVRLWRQRRQALAPVRLSEMSVAERLEDLPQSGALARITADQRCQIEAVVCEKPEKSGQPISHWTHPEIADELIQRQIVAHISPRHAGRLLKRERTVEAAPPSNGSTSSSTISISIRRKVWSVTWRWQMNQLILHFGPQNVTSPDQMDIRLRRIRLNSASTKSG